MLLVHLIAPTAGPYQAIRTAASKPLGKVVRAAPPPPFHTTRIGYYPLMVYQPPPHKLIVPVLLVPVTGGWRWSDLSLPHRSDSVVIPVVRTSPAPKTQANMSDLNYPDAVDDVQDVLETAEAEEDVEIGVTGEDISERLGEYVDARVDPEDAVRYVVEDILEDAGIEDTSQYTRSASGSRRGGSTDNEQLTADEIAQPNQWIEFEGTVLETFETSSNSIAQQGRLADDTGTIRFTIWESSGVETRLEEGESYHLEPVVVNEFQSEFELKVTDVTDINRLEGDNALGIDPDEYTETVRGAIIKFQDQMGLIDRCPNEDCRRVLQQPNYCPDCGDVDSELDVRTKAVIDTGDDTWTVFLDEEDTDALAHIDLEEAKRMVDEHNDRDVVEWAIREELHGEYLKLWGRDRGRRFDVEDFELAPSPTIDDLNELQEELSALP